MFILGSLKKYILLSCYVLITSSIVTAKDDSFQVPQSLHPVELVAHNAIIIGYSETHEQAMWVSYSLTLNQLNPKRVRTNNFRPDPSVGTGSAELLDYYKSGYDRGHLAPAADMTRSSTAMSESFLLSNVSPQIPGFNRGVWKRLESFVRNTIQYQNELFIITGPIFRGNLDVIGRNEVTVPGYYFKVILNKVGDKYLSIGFILPNEATSEPLSTFSISVDKVEEITGLDFYWELPDSIEQFVEASSEYELWCNSNTPTQHLKSASDNNAQGRCVATTKGGSRCKRKTQLNSRFCWQHNR
jgi:endonuclease G, mitochondrial